ncbi:MAG: hypothetical protein ACK55I_41175, partial [bacterium]
SLFWEEIRCRLRPTVAMSAFSGEPHQERALVVPSPSPRVPAPVVDQVRCGSPLETWAMLGCLAPS